MTSTGCVYVAQVDEQAGEDQGKMTGALERSASKVPEVTLVFWVIKIAATTLGETGGDTVTMTLNWGYLAGTACSCRSSSCW